LRIALGIAALWATIYALAVLAGDFAFSHPPAAPNDPGETALGPAFLWASVVNALVVFFAFAFIAGRSERMRAVDKVGWIIAMMFLFPLVVPPFWYLHVWRAPA
jgi:hypothetical protein